MLSWQSSALWAKKTNDNQDKWLPLVVHMADAAEVAKLIWYHWIPFGTKQKIAQGICLSQNKFTDVDDVLPCFVLLAALHDLGKATPSFQGKLRETEFDEYLRRQIIDSGLPLLLTIHPRETKHFWSSQVILEEHKFDRKLAVILGGHHGQPPSNANLYNLRTAYKKDLGWARGQETWRDVQHDLLTYALQLAGVSEQEAKAWQPDITAQVLLSGLVIMVDWLVSDERRFPYIFLSEKTKPSKERAKIAWEDLNFLESWTPDNSWDWMGKNFFRIRFEIEDPRPVQDAVLNLLKGVSNPGIVIIEAPMGEGKTEAALAAAELMANRTGRSGVFFALPTQASANGLFIRFRDWIKRLETYTEHDIYLAHGKANLNKLYSEIRDEAKEMKVAKTHGEFWVGGDEAEETNEDGVIVHEWFSGRKKGILSSFVIGTVDQVLMGSLKQKHLALRHLGLANKVVILDECHAYDAYMSQYLYKILNWLGAYNVPVIVLSATLPGEKRQQLIDAYLNNESTSVLDYDPVFNIGIPEVQQLPTWATTYDYPIITFTNEKEVRQEKVCGKNRSLLVELRFLGSDEQIVTVLENLLSQGGCAGIIVNTVKRAQEVARALSEYFGEGNVHLLHSRFLAVDRSQKEKELFEKLGAGGDRPLQSIVVGTQIFEQSCDLDFDVLITDICPMDLLIQRIGRLHRHDENNKNRLPKLSDPQCYITGMSDYEFERGAELIYGKYLLMNTRELLRELPSLKLEIPKNIPYLVQKSYQSEGLDMPIELQKEYQEAKSKHEQRILKKMTKASDFQISDPYKRLPDLVGWLDTSITDDPTGKRGEATVRDTEDSLEVLVVQRRGKEYYTLPWVANFKARRIPTDMPPEEGLARAIAECSIQLPRELCWDLDKTIKELEIIILHELRAWQQSSWLKGELFLVLDEHLSTVICGYHLQYDPFYGMLSKKIEEENVNA